MRWERKGHQLCWWSLSATARDIWKTLFYWVGNCSDKCSHGTNRPERWEDYCKQSNKRKRRGGGKSRVKPKWLCCLNYPFPKSNVLIIFVTLTGRLMHGASIGNALLNILRQNLQWGKARERKRCKQVRMCQHMHCRNYHIKADRCWRLSMHKILIDISISFDVPIKRRRVDRKYISSRVCWCSLMIMTTSSHDHLVCTAM